MKPIVYNMLNNKLKIKQIRLKKQNKNKNEIRSDGGKRKTYENNQLFK